MPNSTLYETDFYAWANEQAALLRSGQLATADIENIAEEIESMARTEKRELICRLALFLLQLLKWQHQPGLRGPNWRSTIPESRGEVQLGRVGNVISGQTSSPSIPSRTLSIDRSSTRPRLQSSMPTVMARRSSISSFFCSLAFAQ